MRPILYFNGIFLIILSICMVPPLMADLYFGYHDWLVFFTCMVVTSFFGGCLLLGNTAPNIEINRKQVFLITNTAWISISLFAALPFILCSLKMSPSNALFEAVSGVTTTGATVITSLNHAPAGILLWRAILQWIGGITVILMALTILPFLKVGGMHIFRSEFSSDNKALPRTTERGKLLLLLYTVLTLLCTIGYMMAGMEVFDALVHAMTTISTGGFSTTNESFEHFNNPKMEFIAIIFMIFGSLPFILYLSTLRGDFISPFKDGQAKAFLGIVIATSLVIFLFLSQNPLISNFTALRLSVFNTVSLITGTGYFNTDYSVWGPICTSLLLFLMVIGGCAGSSTGGIKIFRFQILYSIVLGQLQKLIFPNSIYLPKYNNTPIKPDIPFSVMGFFFAYALCFVGVAIGLSLTGLDFTTSFSAATSAISNVGPGMGTIIGPHGTYDSLTDTAKMIMCFGMLIGRLEIFTVIVILSPYFWRD